MYDFLNKSHRPLALAYLEHVVYEWSDTNALFHNALAVHYKERILQLDRQQRVEPSPSLTAELIEFRSKLRSFLETSGHYSPEVILVQFPYDCKTPYSPQSFFQIRSGSIVLILKISTGPKGTKLSVPGVQVDHRTILLVFQKRRIKLIGNGLE